jgi:hypothetical protein
VSDGSARWVCARCEVSVGRLDGTRTQLPATWTQSGDSIYCLNCSRALAGEAALDSAPETISRDERVRLRRDAVIEFEIGREPQAPDRTIARACRTSASSVVAVRKALSAADAPHPKAPVGV